MRKIHLSRSDAPLLPQGQKEWKREGLYKLSLKEVN